MAERPPGRASFAALVFILASVALVVQIVAHRLLEDTWGVDGASLSRLLVVTIVQAAVLQLILRRRRQRGTAASRAATGDATPPSSSGFGVFLSLWLLLAVINGVLGAAFSGLVLESLDLRFIALLKLLLVPTGQAVVLPWVAGRWSLTELGRSVGEGLRDRVALALVVSAVLIVAASWFAPVSPAELDLDLAMLWAGLAALAAGAGLLSAVFRWPWSRTGQLALGMLGAWLLALGLDPFTSWIPRLSGLFPEGWPTVLVWAAVGSAMVTLSFAVVIASASSARRRFVPAGVFLDAAGGAGFAVALIAVLSTFLRRYPTPFWSAVLSTGLALSATLAAVAALLLLRHGNDVA